uniref:Secreted protein n=1 Tax=Cyanothece sp. (strain PCC 7425 / ATCC 29141) TaxID=395961 RepID=B8HMD3_CYAP4
MKSLAILPFVLLSMVPFSASNALAETKVISRDCGTSLSSPLLISRNLQPGSSKLGTDENSTGQKICETTDAPATNSKGENGTNRCTSCHYTAINEFSVNCVFIKANTNQ